MMNICDKSNSLFIMFLKALLVYKKIKINIPKIAVQSFLLIKNARDQLGFIKIEESGSLCVGNRRWLYVLQIEKYLKGVAGKIFEVPVVMDIIQRKVAELICMLGR